MSRNGPTTDGGREDVPWERDPDQENVPPPLPAVSEPTVLIVDGDGVSRRVLERALERDGHCIVETAKDGMSALEILRTSRVDIVISETDLPDMAGLRLLRRMQQERRLRRMPVVFVSSDSRTATRLDVLRSGADEFYTKPCDPQDLAARVNALVRKQLRTREAFRRRSYTLAGDLSSLGLQELINLLQMAKRTGTLAVFTDRGTAQLGLVGGMITAAAFGNLTGVQAVYRLVAEPAGWFEFSSEPCELKADPPISDHPTELMMEGARLMDMARLKQKNDPARAKASIKRAPATGLVPTGKAHPKQASQFELGITDGFTLAELRMWTEEELREWTRQLEPHERCHVLVFAPLAASIAAALPLGEAPAERELLASIRPERKTPGLAFFLRGERLLDVVLLDIDHPASFEASLMRGPSVVILAPPSGEFLNVPEHARSVLDGMLAKLAPGAILGMGNDVFGDYLDKLSCVRAGTPVRLVRGTFSDSTDLRALLVQALRVWGEPPAGGAR
jgi:CheY-like chemotaxis protein